MENLTEVPSEEPLPLMWTLYRRGIVRDPGMGWRKSAVGTHG
ncbi:hypothetical protein MY4824_005844 [Beauveria thailandica]